MFLTPPLRSINVSLIPGIVISCQLVCCALLSLVNKVNTPVLLVTSCATCGTHHTVSARIGMGTKRWCRGIVLLPPGLMEGSGLNTADKAISVLNFLTCMPSGTWPYPLPFVVRSGRQT